MKKRSTNHGVTLVKESPNCTERFDADEEGVERGVGEEEEERAIVFLADAVEEKERSVDELRKSPHSRRLTRSPATSSDDPF